MQLEKYYQAEDSMRLVADRLKFLSRSLHFTGNTILADDLAEYAETLLTNADVLKRATTEDVYKRADDAEAMTKTLVCGLISNHLQQQENIES